jgi:hypothetical protein
MGKVLYILLVVIVSLTIVSSCCSKSNKQSSGFYAMGLLDCHQEYATGDSSCRVEHFHISRYIYLDENDSLFLIISDNKTDSLFSIKCSDNERNLFKQHTSSSVNDLKQNPFDGDGSPCCINPIVVFVKNDTLQSPGFVSGCDIDTRELGVMLNRDNRTFISVEPTFDVLEKRYLMEGIIQTANFRSKHPVHVSRVLKLRLPAD